MPRWLRLPLAVALIAIISLTVCPESADALLWGIFDNRVHLPLDFGNDVDDDLDEMLRRLVSFHAAGASAADAVGALPPRLLRLSRVFAGPRLTSSPGRTSAERAPPAGHIRYQIRPRAIEPLPYVVSASRFQPYIEQYSPVSSGPTASPSTAGRQHSARLQHLRIGVDDKAELPRDNRPS